MARCSLKQACAAQGVGPLGRALQILIRDTRWTLYDQSQMAKLEGTTLLKHVQNRASESDGVGGGGAGGAAPLF